MPGLDRTGPEGQGSRTGRQMGKCAPRTKASTDPSDPDDSPQNITQQEGFGRLQDRGPGRGAGRGAGRGTGKGRGRNRGRW